MSMSNASETNLLLQPLLFANVDWEGVGDANGTLTGAEME